MATKLFREAIREALIEELDRNPRMFLMGEDIGRYQGTFRVTEGLFQKYGPKRVWDTPISESGFIYKSGGACAVPMVIRGPAGPGKQLAAQHSHSLEAWLAHSPGLKVVLPSTPADAKGLLKTAIRDNNPVMFIEHPRLYLTKGEVPDGEYTIPFGVADVKRTGRDVTIITYSRGVQLALNAAQQLAEEGIEVEVIDLRTLIPCDWETVFRSVRKTHRAIALHDDWRFVGFGAEIAAQIQEHAFDYLDAPVLRVAGADVPMPYNKHLEALAVPNEQSVIEAVRQIVA
jgi:pyruvate dehydrogenase E1 component beta subunit